MSFILKTHFKGRIDLLKFSIKKVQIAQYIQMFCWNEQISLFHKVSKSLESVGHSVGYHKAV